MSLASVACPCCEEYGFNEKRRKERLSFLELSHADHALAVQLQEQVIVPKLDAIIDRFYDKLLQEPDVWPILKRSAGVDHLRETQSQYLESLGIDFDQPLYWNCRLKVGLAHARAGVPLYLYQCSYRLLQQIILDHVPTDMAAAVRDRLMAFVLKITALDMSIAVEIYHLSQVKDLEHSLDSLRSERLKLRRKASTDTLTGLASRDTALAILHRALTGSVRDDRRVCLIMADLDRFKRVNDTYGHLVGDAVLKDVASRMRSAVRDFDILGRFGGEEFIVVLLDTPLVAAERVAERIRQRVAASPIHHNGLQIDMTISQGLAEAKGEDSVDVLIDRADIALYRAKEGGRNRVEVA